MDFIILVQNKFNFFFSFLFYYLFLGGVFLSVTGCEALFADLGKLFYADLFREYILCRDVQHDRIRFI
jgi:K+ transporter